MIKFAIALLAAVLATSSVSAQPDALKLCSGGQNHEEPCQGPDDCPAVCEKCPPGTCVVSRGVCDGGADDGFACPCPGSFCSSTQRCAERSEDGTCAAGPRAGACCSLEFGCGEGKSCVLTQRICRGGRFKGAPCLRDDQCRDSECIIPGGHCLGGIFPLYPCIDDGDCPNSGCSLTSLPCVGDCDGSGQVTVDEVIAMVSIALGGQPLSACPAADSDGDQAVTVDEILSAVNAALRGCLAG